MIKPILGSQAVIAQPWETAGHGGNGRGVVPEGHLLMPCALGEPIVLRFVGLGAWARLSRGGVRKCTRNAPQLAPHHVALRGRHNTGGMFTGWGIAGGALAGIVGRVCRAAGCFPWYKGFGRAFKRSVMGCSPFMELMGPLQWWTHALLKQGT